MSKVTEEKEGKCPPHHFIINSENVGYCKDCPEVRDFGRLLQREGVFVLAGRRGAKARKGVLGKKGKRRRSSYEKRITFQVSEVEPGYQDIFRRLHQDGGEAQAL